MKLNDKAVEELRALTDETKSIDPARVVEWARTNKGSALHAEFQRRTSWDVQEAAAERWRDVACDIVREYKIIVTETEETIVVKAFVGDSTKRGQLRSTVEIKRQDDQKNMLSVLRQRSQSTRANLDALTNLAKFWGLGSESLDEASTALARFDELLDSVQESGWPKKEKPRRQGRGG